MTAPAIIPASCAFAAAALAGWAEAEGRKLEVGEPKIVSVTVVTVDGRPAIMNEYLVVREHLLRITAI